MLPHRQQPIRLPHPWDSPGKNTTVGFHFLLQCMRLKSESEVAQSCPTLSDPMGCSLPGSSVHGSFQARVLEWGAIAFSGTYSNLLLFMGDKSQGPQWMPISQIVLSSTCTVSLLSYLPVIKCNLQIKHCKRLTLGLFLQLLFSFFSLKTLKMTI